MAVVTDIADAVAASLNAATFSQPVAAERHYQPVFDLADMATLHVSVVPKSLVIAASSRDASQFEVAIDVGVQKKLQSEDAAEVDALVGLVEEIADHLRLKRLDGFPEAAWTGLENEPVFAPEHMDQMRQFTSVLTVTYRLRR